MNRLYKFLRYILLAYLPVLIVSSSIAVGLTQANWHKQVLREINFYGNLSESLKQLRNDLTLQGEPNATPLITLSVIDSLVTPSWLQNLVEQNIDLTTAWLEGSEQDWILYFPSEDIQKATFEQLDDVTQDLIDKDQAAIRVCSDSESEQIRANGFAVDQSLCLPSEVLSGQSTLTEFLAIPEQNGQVDVLSSLIQNSNLPSLSDRVRISNLNLEFKQRINRVRDGLIWFKQNLIWFWVVAGILVIVVLLLAKSADKTFNLELRRLLWLVSLSTVSLILTFSLTFGGIAYLTVIANQYLLPGFALNGVNGVILYGVVRIVLNLVLIALALVAIMIGTNLALLILNKLGLTFKATSKNSKLDKNDNVPFVPENDTLDGQFKKIIQQKAAPTYYTGPVDTLQNFSAPKDYQAPESDFNFDTVGLNQNTPNLDQPTQFNFRREGDFFEPEGDYDMSGLNNENSVSNSSNFNPNYNPDFAPDRLENMQTNSTDYSRFDPQNIDTLNPDFAGSNNTSSDSTPTQNNPIDSGQQRPKPRIKGL